MFKWEIDRQSLDSSMFIPANILHPTVHDLHTREWLTVELEYFIIIFVLQLNIKLESDLDHYLA